MHQGILCVRHRNDQPNNGSRDNFGAQCPQPRGTDMHEFGASPGLGNSACLHSFIGVAE